MLDKLNGWQLYLIAGLILLFISAYCVIVFIKAYKAGIAMGMDKSKIKTAVLSSISFTALPSIAILLGVIALSGSLGVPLPWLRLSVVGALQYETTVADVAARAVGLSGLSINEMTLSAYATIALLISVAILFGTIFSTTFNKRYSAKFVFGEQIETKDKKKSKFAGFGDKAFIAMFVGMCCAYIGSYVGQFVQMQNGKLVITGEYLQLVALGFSALTMYILIKVSEKTKKQWIDSFSLALSMLVGMAASVIAGLIF